WHGWNTIIGEGMAAEPARDVLVLVRVSSPGEAFLSGAPLIIVARTNGKELARRVVHTMLFNKSGRFVAGMFLPDPTCNPLEIEGIVAACRRREHVDFRCEE